MTKYASVMEIIEFLSNIGMLQIHNSSVGEVLTMAIPDKYLDEPVSNVALPPREMHSLQRAKLYPIVGAGDRNEDFPIRNVLSISYQYLLKSIKGCGLPTVKSLKTKCIEHIYKEMTDEEKKMFVFNLLNMNNGDDWFDRLMGMSKESFEEPSAVTA